MRFTDKTKVYEVITKMNTPANQYYYQLPRLVEGAPNTIYTIQRTPTRSFPVFDEDMGSYVTREIPSKVQIFLVFDLMGKLKDECLWEGQCALRRSDSIVMIEMDGINRSDATIQYYMDCSKPFNIYVSQDIHFSNYNPHMEHKYLGEVVTEEYIIPYQAQCTLSISEKSGAPMVPTDYQKLLTDAYLMGGTKKVTTEKYSRADGRYYINEVDKPVTGILENITIDICHNMPIED